MLDEPLGVLGKSSNVNQKDISLPQAEDSSAKLNYPQEVEAYMSHAIERGGIPSTFGNGLPLLAALLAMLEINPPAIFPRELIQQPRR